MRVASSQPFPTFFLSLSLSHSLPVPLSQVCLMGKYHNILYIALRTCWDWGVRDSEVVVRLLGKSKAKLNNLIPTDVQGRVCVCV